MRIPRIAFSVSLLLLGCVDKPEELHLRSVLDEAQTNELGPTSRLRTHKIAISGIVERTGLRKQKEWSHSAASGFGTWTVESERIQRHYPYVVVAPEDRKPGRALCFFEMSDADDIAKLTIGDKIRFEGDLQEFLKKDGQEVMVMQCRVGR